MMNLCQLRSSTMLVDIVLFWVRPLRSLSLLKSMLNVIMWVADIFGVSSMWFSKSYIRCKYFLCVGLYMWIIVIGCIAFLSIWMV